VITDGGDELISINEASKRLGISRNALYLQFGDDITPPERAADNQTYMRWPKVQIEWLAHKAKPRANARPEGTPPKKKPAKPIPKKVKKTPNPPKVRACVAPKPTPQDTAIEELIAKEPILTEPKAAPVVKERTKPDQFPSYSGNPIPLREGPKEPTQYTKVRTAATVVKLKHFEQRAESEKAREPFAIRSERAKAEKDETSAASALIELHLKAKTLMPVDELEDRLRERDSVIRDRFTAMAAWLREKHPNIDLDILKSVHEYRIDSLHRLGQGVLTEDERDSAEEMISILNEKDMSVIEPKESEEKDSE